MEGISLSFSQTVIINTAAVVGGSALTKQWVASLSMDCESRSRRHKHTDPWFLSLLYV